jgi:hypothetical protein
MTDQCHRWFFDQWNGLKSKIVWGMLRHCIVRIFIWTPEAIWWGSARTIVCVRFVSPHLVALGLVCYAKFPVIVWFTFIAILYKKIIKRVDIIKIYDPKKRALPTFVKTTVGRRERSQKDEWHCCGVNKNTMQWHLAFCGGGGVVQRQSLPQTRISSVLRRSPEDFYYLFAIRIMKPSGHIWHKITFRFRSKVIKLLVLWYILTYFLHHRSLEKVLNPDYLMISHHILLIYDICI